MKWLLKLSRKHERPFLLAVMFAALGVLYWGVQAIPHYQPAQVVMWDPVWRIPFISVFILPYWSVFIMPLIFLWRPGDNVFLRRWILTVLATAAVSAVVFAIWPLYLPYPTLMTDDPFRHLVALTYYIDVRGNFCPSQHVVLAFLMALALVREHPAWRWPLLIWATIIAISTLFVRQHYAIDVVSGLALALLAWSVLMRCTK